jgi:hypothetical protein
MKRGEMVCIRTNRMETGEGDLLKAGSLLSGGHEAA